MSSQAVLERMERQGPAAVLEALSTYEFSEAVHPSPLSVPRAQAQVAEQKQWVDSSNLLAGTHQSEGTALTGFQSKDG
ncbi:hypothetical protein EYF80_039461 [Liparis tanakae]|uniref:Uncharacterized protein n=1 Tax=Liparis tanakae TaxID=230148 RepID=A0A4Z2GBQ1_9TELE|nr:hypothetical protein EYF80_039461 [Liparis tanakae]